MSTVFIANLAVVLPPRFAEGDTLGARAAAFLQQIMERRIMARLRWLKDHGAIDVTDIQAKATALAEEELDAYVASDEENADDPVHQEAMEMARTLIIARMSAEGLPPPKGLDTHAKALVDGMPTLLERARRRVEARFQAAHGSLGDLN